jgi:hypothetical protein
MGSGTRIMVNFNTHGAEMIHLLNLILAVISGILIAAPAFFGMAWAVTTTWRNE